MLPFNTQVFLSPPPISKSWPDSVGAVSASKAVFQSGALWRPVAVFQITSGAVDIKIAFIYWLLYVPTVAQITTLLSQQGLCRPLLLLCQWRKCAFQLWVHPRRWMLKGSCVCIWESENDNDSMFALGKPIPQQENVNAFDNLTIIQAWDILS